MSQSDGNISFFGPHHTEKKRCRHALSLKHVNEARTCVHKHRSQPSGGVFHKNDNCFLWVYKNSSADARALVRLQRSLHLSQVVPQLFVSLRKRSTGSTFSFHSNERHVWFSSFSHSQTPTQHTFQGCPGIFWEMQEMMGQCHATASDSIQGSGRHDRSTGGPRSQKK